MNGATTVSKKWWQGTNVYISAALLVSGLWAGINEGDVTTAVSGIFATISAIGAIRVAAKGTRRTLGEWWASANTKNYLATLVVNIFPLFPGEIVDQAISALTMATNKNWPGFATAILSAATMAYFFFIKKKSKG